MNQIPESARRRMQARPVGEHPDADLLSAFTEHLLSGQERERVLTHLAACAACREVVSLALPQEAEVVESGAPAGSWFRWPVLRWTALAATVIVVGAAVSVLVPRQSSDQTASNDSVPAQKVPPAPSTQNAEAREQENHPAEAKGPRARRDVAQASGRGSAAKENKKQVAQGVVAQLRNEEVAAQPAAAPTPRIQAAEAQSAKGRSFQQITTADEVAKTEPARQDSALADKDTAKGAVAGGQVSENRNRALAPPSSPPPPSAENQVAAASGMRATAPVARDVFGGPVALAKAKKLDAATRWRVSSAGAIERSTSGAAWEKVEIDPGVTFRALSSTSGDLWAGGTGGALFHSADAGRTWSRVRVGDEGMWVSEALVGVDFPNATNGFVTTTSGAVWQTQDAGRTWQRRH